MKSLFRFAAALGLASLMTACPVYVNDNSPPDRGGEGPCIGSGCDPATRGCRTTRDCDGTDVCIEGKCRLRDDTCQFSYQCGGERSCVNGACTEVCGMDASVCGSASTCQGGYCRPAEDCSDGVCPDGKDCVLGRCLNSCGSGGSCTNPADYCAEDGYCRPDWRQRPECTKDTDCAGGAEGKRVCRAGACRTPCPTKTDDQCRMSDDTIPYCRADATGEYLCYVTTTVPTAMCRTERDCSTALCIDATCK